MSGNDFIEGCRAWPCPTPACPPLVHIVGRSRRGGQDGCGGRHRFAQELARRGGTRHESSGSYGAGIARYLMAAGEDVKEVPAFASHRERRTRPSKGKSDVADAVAIARVVARGEGLASPVRLEVFQDLKMLVDQRDHLVHARTQLINRTHRDLVVSHPGYEARIPKLNSRANQTAALVLLRRDRSVRANLTRDRIADIRRLKAKVAAVEKSIGMKL